MLERYRCLDLCDEKGSFAGKLLGEMGADVIKVERPVGARHPLRQGEQGVFSLSIRKDRIGD